MYKTTINYSNLVLFLQFFKHEDITDTHEEVISRTVVKY